jgi:hypothetical protein
VLSALGDETFGAWLAGLIDGEGCFTIQHDRRDGSYRCHFALKLRADDGPLLEALCERTALGQIYREGRRPPSRPCLSWRISSRPDCVALAALLERTPPQSKKARDFEIWRQAVDVWVTRAPRRGSRWGPAKSGDDWSKMAELDVRLRAVRAYA